MVTDRQWLALSRLPVFPKPRPRPFRRAKRRTGRPAITDRAAFEAVVWIMLGRRSWRRLPRHLGPWTSLRRRIKRWGQRRLEALWRRYLHMLPVEQRADVGLALDCRPPKRRPRWWQRLAAIYWANFTPENDPRVFLYDEKLAQAYFAKHPDEDCEDL